MHQVEVKDQRPIDADTGVVWEAIKSPALHADWHPFLTGIEGEHALGAERSCAVSIGGKPSRTRERCIIEDTQKRIIWRIDEDTSGFSRMVSDWTAGFSLTPSDGRTVVTAQSAFRPRNPLIRLMMPLVRRKFHQAQQAILEGLDTFVAGDLPKAETRSE